MRTISRVTAGLLAGAAAVAAIGAANAQDGATEAPPAEEAAPLATEGADGELVDRLLEVQAELPPSVPSEVIVPEDDADARITGDFGEARIAFDALEGELQSLFVDAEDAGTPTGSTVAAVASGLLLEREAVAVLEQADDLDVARPIDASDSRDANELAIDADDPAGKDLVGVRLLLDARLRQLAGIAPLAEADPAFADRLDELATFADTLDPQLRDAVGIPNDQLLVTVDRFDAPPGQARATASSYVCVDRVAYLLLIAGGETPAAATAATAVEPDDGCTGVLQQDAPTP